MKSFMTPTKSQPSTIIRSPLSEPPRLSLGEIKSLELQALSLLDSDITSAKQLIERCLRQVEDAELPVIENL
jgi:hypothetical protein